MKNLKGLLLIGVLTTLFLTSCTSPCPIYGKWQSQANDTIMFDTDGSFSSSITTFADNNKFVKVSGKYKIVKTSIQVTDDDGKILPPATWSLDGAILIIDWPIDNSTTRRIHFFRVEAK